jgi:hypothetical protein
LLLGLRLLQLQLQLLHVRRKHAIPVSILSSAHVLYVVCKEPGIEVVPCWHRGALPTYQQVTPLAVLRAGCRHCNRVRALQAAAGDHIGCACQLSPQAVQLSQLVAAQEWVQQVVSDYCEGGATVLDCRDLILGQCEGQQSRLMKGREADQLVEIENCRQVTVTFQSHTSTLGSGSSHCVCFSKCLRPSCEL